MKKSRKPVRKKSRKPVRKKSRKKRSRRVRKRKKFHMRTYNLIKLEKLEKKIESTYNKLQRLQIQLEQAETKNEILKIEPFLSAYMNFLQIQLLEFWNESEDEVTLKLSPEAQGELAGIKKMYGKMIKVINKKLRAIRRRKIGTRPMMIEMSEIKKRGKFKFADNTLCHRSGDSKRTCKKKSRKPKKRKKKKSRKPKKRREKRGSRKVVNLPLKKRFRMKKLPGVLKEEISAFIPNIEGVGRLATVNKHTLNASKKELKERRFYATDETLRGAVKEYLRNKRSAIRKYGNISGWDVSKVTDMREMFIGARSFNGDLSKWNVSNVTNMERMFAGAKKFDGDISKWNVSNVTDMRSMFGYASSFNGDISKWNVSNVTDMSYMFLNARSFNGDLSRWNVSNVTDMYGMFELASSFNGDLSKWNVSNVTNMERMFAGAKKFDGDLSRWNVSKVADMERMFFGADSFDKKNAPWYPW